MARRNSRRAKSDGTAGMRSARAARWRRLIEEQAKSGLTQEVFCRAQGVSVHGFRDWKYGRLAQVEGKKRQARPSPASSLPVPVPSFVPVEVVFDQLRPEVKLGPVGIPSCSGVEVVLGDHLRVAVRSGFDAQVLRKVVEVLGC